VEGWENIGIGSSGDDILDVKLEIVGWMLLDCVVGGGYLKLFDLARFIFISGDD
jgi:hypothetical protein